MQTCANCGKTIGRLEIPNIWREVIVCAECHQRLSAATPAKTKPVAVILVAFSILMGVIATLLVMHFLMPRPPAIGLADPNLRALDSSSIQRQPTTTLATRDSDESRTQNDLLRAEIIRLQQQLAKQTEKPEPPQDADPVPSFQAFAARFRVAFEDLCRRRDAVSGTDAPTVSDVRTDVQRTTSVIDPVIGVFQATEVVPIDSASYVELAWSIQFGRRKDHWEMVGATIRKTDSAARQPPSDIDRSDDAELKAMAEKLNSTPLP